MGRWAVALMVVTAGGCGSPLPGSEEGPPCGNGALDEGEACDDGARNSDSDPRACRTDCSGRCRCSRHLECTFAGDTYACSGECPEGYFEYSGGPGGEPYERWCELDGLDVQVVTAAGGEPIQAWRAHGPYAAEVDGDTVQVALIVTAPPTVTVAVEGMPVPSGEQSGWIDVHYGSNLVEIELHDTVEMYSMSAIVLIQQGMDLSYIKASNTDAGDRFGSGVDVHGDTLVVGASSEASASTEIDGDQEDDSAPRRGAVYVFRHDGTTWSQEAYLKSPNPAELHFADVGLGGDLLAVGGSAGLKIFRRDGALWSLEAALADQSCREPQVSGDTVAVLCGNVARVYRTDTSGWALEAALDGTDAPGGFRLVDGIAFAGDTLIARGEKEVAGGAGSEFVTTTLIFRREGTTWSLDESLCIDEDACAGDTVLSRDGTRMAVRAGYADLQRELLHVLARGASGWAEEAVIEAQLPDLGDVLAIDGDRLAIRAAMLVGTVTWLHERGSGDWGQRTLIAHPTLLNGDNLFWELALEGDVLVMGAQREPSAATGIDGDARDTSAPEAGAVFALRLP